MSERTVRIAGLAGTVAYGALVGWLYLHQPQTLAQVTGGLTSAVGVYRIDRRAFDEGRRFFRNDQFVEARMAFERADPAIRDPVTQFYIAYTYYRQGWGRMYSDDDLYALGLQAVDRAIALAPNGRIVVEDENLGMKSAEELKAEFEAGLRREMSDFNPARLLRERK